MKFLDKLKEAFDKTNVTVVNYLQDNPDKIAHFILGYLVALVFWWPLGFFTMTPVFLAAVFKEWYDSKSHGKPDYKDFFYTILGGFVFLVSVVFAVVTL